jgi:hypothetical protein
MIDGSESQLKLAIEKTLKNSYHLNDIADFSVDDLLSDIMTDIQTHLTVIKANIIDLLEK